MKMTLKQDFQKVGLMSVIGASVLAVSLAFMSQPAWAGKPSSFANVVAKAVCEVTGQNVRVVALLEQTEKISVDEYKVGLVTFALEEKDRAVKYEEVADEPVLVDASFDAVEPGEQVEVADYTFEGICAYVDPNFNSVRAVVEIEVLNANPNRKEGLIHTGRCISFSNPCQQ